MVLVEHTEKGNVEEENVEMINIFLVIYDKYYVLLI
jgi:hypothetical protein